MHVMLKIYREEGGMQKIQRGSKSYYLCVDDSFGPGIDTG